MTTTNRLSRQLAALGACAEACAWARDYDSFVAAWAACPRGDWMLWVAAILCGDRGSARHREVVLAACACARTAFRDATPGDERPLRAIEAAERWARREGATLRDVRAAAAAAYAAACPDAAAITCVSAYVAAYAAASAYAAHYGFAAAANDATQSECADICRSMLTNVPEWWESRTA